MQNVSQSLEVSEMPWGEKCLHTTSNCASTKMKRGYKRKQREACSLITRCRQRWGWMSPRGVVDSLDLDFDYCLTVCSPSPLLTLGFLTRSIQTNESLPTPSLFSCYFQTTRLLHPFESTSTALLFMPSHKSLLLCGTTPLFCETSCDPVVWLLPTHLWARRGINAAHLPQSYCVALGWKHQHCAPKEGEWGMGTKD